jgi:phosphate transport system protein
VVDSTEPYNKQVLETSKVLDMFNGAIAMLNKVIEALDKEDTTVARSVLSQDDALDVINKNALNVAADIIRKQPDMLEQSLNVFSIVRKLERVGDQVTNIAEEIIFFIEAKVLKHKSGFKKE